MVRGTSLHGPILSILLLVGLTIVSGAAIGAPTPGSAPDPANGPTDPYTTSTAPADPPSEAPATETPKDDARAPPQAPSTATEAAGTTTDRLNDALRETRGDAPAIPLTTQGPPTAPAVPTRPSAQEGDASPLSRTVAEHVPSAVSDVGTTGWALLGLGAIGTVTLARRRRGTDATSSTPEEPETEPVTAPTTGVHFRPVGPTTPSTSQVAASARDERDPVEHPGIPGMLLLGREAMRRGETTIAAAWFRSVLRLDEACQTAHLCHGVCLRRLGEHGAAVERLRHAAELDPTDALARLHLARALVAHGDTAGAMDTLAELAGADPRVDEAIYTDQAFAPLQDHPRFLMLVDRL